MKRHCVPLIPALNPPDCLIGIAGELKAEGFEDIIVVDDGSAEEYRKVFAELRDRFGCDVLANARNMGQGQALKNGMAHYLETYAGEYEGVIAMDCDGQHLVKDAVRIDEEMGEGARALILGARDFTRENVPAKSRIGNRVMRGILRCAAGGNIRDTQTGLRGIPNDLVRECLSVPGDRFEYNTAVLAESIRKGIPIREIPIETVYIDNNRGTHFRPVADSVRVIRSLLSFRRAGGRRTEGKK